MPPGTALSSPSTSCRLSRRLAGSLWDPIWLHLLHSEEREERDEGRMYTSTEAVFVMYIQYVFQMWVTECKKNAKWISRSFLRVYANQFRPISHLNSDVALWMLWTLQMMCTLTNKPLTVCPWNVLMGLSCPSLQTWMHMSVLQEANVLLLCQSTSSAGAAGDRRWLLARSKTHCKILQPGKLQIVSHKERCFCTWMEGKLLFGFSCMGIPYDCCLAEHTYS